MSTLTPSATALIAKLLAPPRPAVRVSPPGPIPAAKPRPWDRVKAVADPVLAAVLLVGLLPVLAMAAAAIRLTSRGPAIYTQTRVGRGGRTFTLYKLRTMHHDCEKLTGPQWSPPGDPRVTEVGELLRTFHIDELPQLWNVIRGEMALIGPRPERPEICAEIRRHVANYDSRHAVKPGLTGLAQVNLPPDTTMASVRRKLAYDRCYLANRGLRMDLRIALLTVLKLLGVRKLEARSKIQTWASQER